jgi:hypothetical protein
VAALRARRRGPTTSFEGGSTPCGRGCSLRASAAATPVLAWLGLERESMGGERWREVEEATDTWVPHVSEMRGREKEN